MTDQPTNNPAERDPHQRAIRARATALECVQDSGPTEPPADPSTGIVFALLAIEARIEEVGDVIGGELASIARSMP